MHRTSNFRAAVLAALGALACAAPAGAAVNLIADGDFENLGTPPGGFTVIDNGRSVGAWHAFGPTQRGAAVQLLSNTYTEPNIAFNAQSGQASMDLSGPGNVGPDAEIEQVVDTVVGHRYQLSFWVGNADGSRNGNYTLPSSVGLFIQDDVARIATPADGIELTFTNADTTPLQTNWRLFQTTFTASNDRTLIGFSNATPIGDAETGLDNVSLVEVVPEPASWSLMIVGFGFAGGLIRRRRGQGQARSILAR